MTEHEIKIAFTEYNAFDELVQADKNLCLEAEKALATSHSPYSKFRVGVALQLQSGKILHASNQENVAYPSGLCAERVAIFNWGANHKNDPVISMAVTAQTDEFELLKPITSCGSCLQVMAECEKMQNQSLRVLLYCINGPVWVINNIQSMLPFMFFEERLTHTA
ncbi:cytidine deaminase [Mucilaginibacter pallidiroseus]|uniref:Cytidine deaminase n=1 Tax=Mucilaginibacter pallidiroseus TaxID=2599295 RepID=A0A563U7P0_9SPHI|nr:cytidine deaminase [Mucilaginibacter pallidiroseus]TWR27343.1 cytidine deaminase [Mucilaginibacter pallidiroseus]